MQRVGLIGLDTSHVSGFAGILNDPEHPHHIDGFRISVAYPGGTPGFDLSIGRVAGFTEELRDQYGVEIVDTPEAVAEHCDLLFITAVDGRVHRALFERTLGHGRPTFIDKPFATSAADAEAMMAMAAQSAIPLMSCSALRYADGLQNALVELGDAIIGCTAYGPMAVIPELPGLYWYGIHTIEMVVAAMGPGCQSVHTTRTELADVVAMTWNDGRVAAAHGLREAHHKFGVALHTPDGATFIDPTGASERPIYAPLLEAILRSLPEGRGDVFAAEMLEVMRIIDAANESRETGRRVVLES